MIYKYYGPPGTGKTYRLISRAKAYARKGVSLDRIGYFAFTKKAADEANLRIHIFKLFRKHLTDVLMLKMNLI
jgi:superfamily I DNA/RNA helicase